MILLVRGDLQSETGWSRATRALVDAIAGSFTSIFGVDLHFHSRRSQSVFPYPVVDEGAAARVFQNLGDVVVLHACQPPGIRHYRGALNVGWWFWETDRILTDRDWLERIEALDLLLAPSAWQAAWIRQIGINVPVERVPWPHRIVETQDRASPCALTTYRLFDEVQMTELAQISDAVAKAGRHETTRKKLFSRQDELLAAQGQHRNYGPSCARRYALAVQSDAPRKGLACLLSEWARYRAAGGEIDELVIRFSSVNVHHDACTLMNIISNIAHIALRGDKAVLSSIRVAVHSLSEGSMLGLMAGAEVYLVASFGEGFGGTLVEAVQAGTLPVAPNHTAVAELLPPFYPLAYPTVPYIGALVGQLPIQPANGTWHLPQPGTIAAALRGLDAMDANARMEAMAGIRQHLKTNLDPSDIAMRMLNAINQVSRREQAA